MLRATVCRRLGREDGVSDGAALGVRGRVAPRPSRRVVLVVDERSPRAVLRAERLPHHFLRVGAGVGEDARERQDLNRLNLYLVDWGYNTERERRDAQQDSKVELISLPAFSERLRSGFQ